MSRFGATAILMAIGLAFLPGEAQGQFFGRNKVQYDDFDFRVLETPHFDIHYYPEAARAIEDVARMSERWYERLARTFQHEFESKKPLIFYADHPDFQQTNTLRGFISEGTGGVTESLKNRVIMPLAGSYWDTDHVLGHELVHAFQYNIAQARGGRAFQAFATMPLWLVEGMAEFLSVGRSDPLTAMWLRDALLREDFPTISQMSRERRFFPYRFGQALWAYVAGTYGDDAVVNIFRGALRIGSEPAFRQVLGVSTDTLSAQWQESVAQAYGPFMEGRDRPEELGTLLIGPTTGAGQQNVSPSVSPDGSQVAFLSEKDLFSVDLFLANTETGQIRRKLVSATSDPHGDALRYIDSSGTWSPDGSLFAYVVFDQGDNAIVIVDASSGAKRQTLHFDEVGAITHPAWSPDGRYIAFSGMSGGISDLYLYDFQADELTQLTNDRYADQQPAWSPDGRTLAFASDRGPETDFTKLTFGSFQIATMDMRTRAIRVLPIFGDVRHSNPQFSPDGRSLYFLSDADGFSDVFRIDLATQDLFRVTRVATGISGIVPMSPALTVAQDSGDILFTVFEEFGFTIHRLPPDTPGTPLMLMADAGAFSTSEARRLPPGEPARFNLVEPYLADAETGLDPVGAYQDGDADDYDPSLALDFVGQPSLGVGADQFGNYVGGGASAAFSDMLGNQNLFVVLQAQGTFQDIGGQVFYTDVGDRWNWATGVSHFPLLFIQQGIDQEFARDEDGNLITDPETGEPIPTTEPFLLQRRTRLFQTNASGQIAYPFDLNRRLELSLGFTRFAVGIEDDRFFLDPFGRIFGFERVQRDDLEPDATNLAQLGVAFVGDNSFFGFISPIRGGRYRFEVQQNVGTEQFLFLQADWRRYWAPHQNLTIAFRGLHLGRYGDIGNNLFQPYFLGFEGLIRGYAFESFQNQECVLSAAQNPNFDPLGGGLGQQSTCPTFDRLFGQRIGVLNLEARIPLIGTEQFGLINFPFLPTELSFFLDGGLAWDGDRTPTLELSRSSSERVPVFSAGVSARFNVLGFLILETYYALPFQRPERGWHWGFNIFPSW